LNSRLPASAAIVLGLFASTSISAKPFVLDGSQLDSVTAASGSGAEVTISAAVPDAQATLTLGTDVDSIYSSESTSADPDGEAVALILGTEASGTPGDAVSLDGAIAAADLENFAYVDISGTVVTEKKGRTSITRGTFTGNQESIGNGSTTVEATGSPDAQANASRYTDLGNGEFELSTFSIHVDKPAPAAGRGNRP